MSRTAVRVLEAQGHEVAVSDLYAMSFNAVASAEDFAQRADPDYLVYALEQRQNHQSGTIAPDIAAEIEKVVACDLLILNFPIFWFSTPAILKGWIDRVLVSGQFYSGKPLGPSWNSHRPRMRRYCSPWAWVKLRKYRASQSLLPANALAAFVPAFRILSLIWHRILRSLPCCSRARWFDRSNRPCLGRAVA